MSSENKKPGVDVEKAADDYVEFLKDPVSKNAIKEFIFETFKKYENERIERFKARVKKEHEVDSQGIDEHHVPGNISPLLAETFNMHEVESGFARSMKATKKSLIRSVDERVEEINRLLSGIGGFSSQLKSSFARSTVVFLEQEDPKRPFRERLVFSINLPNYELKAPWSKEGEKDPKKGPTDGRTPMQATWDNAVNALAHIIETTGLKPKYCKNDRHFGRFVMKQDLLHSSHLPDEYFSFTLDYNTADKIKDMCEPYNKIVAKYEKQLSKYAKALEGHPQDSKAPSYLRARKKYLGALQERDYFVGTTPDPNQLDEGLLFLIEVSTLKDYQIVKDRMQSIMTSYILHLSRIAAQEAMADPALEHELRRLEMRNEALAKAKRGPEKEDADSLQEYEIDEAHLKPIPKKRAG